MRNIVMNVNHNCTYSRFQVKQLSQTGRQYSKSMLYSLLGER